MHSILQSKGIESALKKKKGAQTEDPTINYLEVKLNWNSLQHLGHPKAKVNEKTIFHANGHQKRAGIAILISEK